MTENTYYYFKREAFGAIFQVACFEWVDNSLKLISSESFDCDESFKDLVQIDLTEYREILSKNNSYLATKVYLNYPLGAN